jgi:hypothetical protein
MTFLYFNDLYGYFNDHITRNRKSPARREFPGNGDELAGRSLALPNGSESVTNDRVTHASRDTTDTDVTSPHTSGVTKLTLPSKLACPEGADLGSERHVGAAGLFEEARALSPSRQLAKCEETPTDNAELLPTRDERGDLAYRRWCDEGMARARPRQLSSRHCQFQRDQPPHSRGRMCNSVP